MQNHRAVCLVLFLTLPLAMLGGSASAKEKAPNFVQAMLDRVELGKPIQGKLVILFPLVLKGEGVPLEVASQFDSGGASFEEPEFPDRRYGVTAKNAGDKPVLLLGGTVLVGGERDRIVRHDCVVPAGGSLEMDAFPAASNSDIRREVIPFQMAKSLAPVYLRKEANFGGSSNMVPTFVARNLEFRNEGDKRKSLAAIGESQLLQDWTKEARDKVSKAMQDVKSRGRIVGFISSMRGRIQGFSLYGSRALLQSAGAAYLLGATYSAAAVAIQADKKKIPLPGLEDPAKNLANVTAEANKLLEKLRKARFKADKKQPDGALGERVQIQLSDRTRGRAVGVDGRLVHMAVYPYDPFEAKLYGTAIRIPGPPKDEGEDATGDDDGPVMYDPDRMGLAELSRWAGRGHRVTHSEQRLLNGIGRGGRGGGGGFRAGGGVRGGQGGGGGGRRR